MNVFHVCHATKTGKHKKVPTRTNVQQLQKYIYGTMEESTLAYWQSSFN